MRDKNVLIQVITNEVMPRRKKFGYFPPAHFVALLAGAKADGQLAHRDLRTLLDTFYAK